MGVLALLTGLRTLDPPLGPPSTLAEIFFRDFLLLWIQLFRIKIILLDTDGPKREHFNEPIKTHKLYQTYLISKSIATIFRQTT